MPLSTTAVAVLRALPRGLHGDVFPGVTTEAVKRSYMRAIRRAGIEDLRFHDLRHEATTRLFEKGLNIMEVAQHHRAQGPAHAAAVYTSEGGGSGAEAGVNRASTHRQRRGDTNCRCDSLRSFASSLDAMIEELDSDTH